MSSVFNVLDAQLKEEEDNVKDVILTNRVGSFEEYRHLTGHLRGLAIARGRLNALRVKVENEDWED